MERSRQYDDMIDLPHHVSTKRPHMPILDRAAQFAPFAALTGYGEEVEETARFTDEKPELTEEQKQAIGRMLSKIEERKGERMLVSVAYFLPDGRKSGGQFLNTLGRVKRIDSMNEELALTDGTVIPFRDIIALELTEK